MTSESLARTFARTSNTEGQARTTLRRLRRFAPSPASPEKLIPRALHLLACSVADKRGRADARALGMRAELITEAESAAGLALACILSRFPRALALYVARMERVRDCLPRRATQHGPSVPRPPSLALPLSVWRAAHKACDKALRKMAREVATDDAARVFDATGWTDEANARDPRELELAEGAACAVIRTKAERMRGAIRARADGCNGNTMRAASAFLSRVNEWERRALELARGEGGAPILALSTRADDSRDVVESLAIHDANGRPVSHDGRGGVSGSRKRRDAERHAVFCRAWLQVSRLECFLGRDLATV